MYTKPPPEELKRKLSPLQYEVTQNDATEPPFRNKFWDNHAPGLYVDVVTGEPLFSSLDKFESGTGWPSFVRPIENGHVALETDTTLGMTRTEVRSSAGGSHLGHVFDDGPAPTGLRYCINSAALRFIPADRLVVEGYGAYAARFGSGASAAPLAAATDNACAAPKPGDQPGCQTTLDTALFAGGARTKAALEKVAGVLDIETGTTERTDTVQVIFDPKQVAYADLLNEWAAIERPEGLKGRIIFVTSNEQRDAAEKWKDHLGDRAGQTGPVIVRKGDSTLFTPSTR